MKIIYYKSVLCPRCISTNHLLAELRREQPEIEIEERELLTHFSEAMQDKVHTLPTLIIGGQRFEHAPHRRELLSALGGGTVPSTHAAAEGAIG